MDNYLASWLSGLWIGAVTGVCALVIDFAYRAVRDALKG